MTTQEQADKIENLFGLINELVTNKNSSLMIHDIKYVNELDESWQKDVLISGDRIVLNAKKGGITLFGQEFMIEHSGGASNDTI